MRESQRIPASSLLKYAVHKTYNSETKASTDKERENDEKCANRRVCSCVHSFRSVVRSFVWFVCFLPKSNEMAEEIQQRSDKSTTRLCVCANICACACARAQLLWLVCSQDGPTTHTLCSHHLSLLASTWRQKKKPIGMLVERPLNTNKFI